tara:strand:- start:1517 stop:1858 length:342 start_codon:yes stop_codon:yes gene_type:complete
MVGISEAEEEPEIETIKNEFEISIGLERNEDESLKMPTDEEHLTELIRINIEHNCNKLLPFCCEMLGNELKPEMDTLKLSMEVLKKELIDKTHELVDVKLKLAKFTESSVEQS